MNQLIYYDKKFPENQWFKVYPEMFKRFRAIECKEINDSWKIILKYD